MITGYVVVTASGDRKYVDRIDGNSAKVRRGVLYIKKDGRMLHAYPLTNLITWRPEINGA